MAKRKNREMKEKEKREKTDEGRRVLEVEVSSSSLGLCSELRKSNQVIFMTV